MMNAIDLESCRFMSLINITEIDKVIKAYT